MSLSQQLFTFIAVGLVYVIFTFAWGWYVDRKEDSGGFEPPEEAPPNEPEPENTGGDA